jgi:hypothetical protein
VLYILHIYKSISYKSLFYLFKLQEEERRKRSSDVPEWFASMDANNNGVLDQQEIDRD